MSEPHDVLCTNCNEQIDQCLDDDCPESDHHHAEPDQYCEVCDEDEKEIKQAIESSTAIRTRIEQAERVIQELIEWNASMGYFDAPAWKLAHDFRHKYMKGD